MKTKLLLFSIFACVQSLNAQLTNRQVYDFEVGDVFHIQYEANVIGPPLSHLDTIIQKSVSVGLDSITYTIARKAYAPAWTNGSFYYVPSIEKLVVSNLNESVTHYNGFSCAPDQDSTFTGNCNEMIERKYFVWDTSCMDPPIWRSDVILGLGGPYYDVYDPSSLGTPDEYQRKKLIFYNSKKQGQCGSKIKVVGLNEELFASIQLFPVPSSNSIQLNTPFIQWKYTIYAQNGSMVASGESHEMNQNLDISHLQNGYYFVEILSENGDLIQKPLIKID